MGPYIEAYLLLVHYHVRSTTWSDRSTHMSSFTQLVSSQLTDFFCATIFLVKVPPGESEMNNADI